MRTVPVVVSGTVFETCSQKVFHSVSNANEEGYLKVHRSSHVPEISRGSS